MKKELERERNYTYALKEQIKVLRQQLSDAGKMEEIIPADSNCTYLYIPKWVATYFTNKLVFTNRAHKCLKNAAAPGSGAYGGNGGEKIKKVYEWLQFLGTEYWQMKMRERDIQSVWEKAQNIGIYNYNDLEQPPMSEVTVGQHGKEAYDTYKGKECPIKCHLDSPPEAPSFSYGEEGGTPFLFVSLKYSINHLKILSGKRFACTLR